MLPSLMSMLSDLNVKPIDIKTKEGYDEAKRVIKEAKENDFCKLMMNDNFLDELESIIDKTYTDANFNKDEFVKPSTHCSETQKHRVTELVNEYVDGIIQPLGNFSGDTVTSIKNSLFEFACWLLNK